MKRALLIVVSLLLTFGCNGDKPPTAPSTPVVPPVTVVSLSVAPLVQTIPPGQTVQLTATARFSDGSTRDVTSEANWTSSQENVAFVSGGAVTGARLGRTVIRANFHSGGSTSMTIVIEPNGTFILKGRVTEPVGVGVSGAGVEVLSGPPSQVTTNSDGFYELFGMAGTLILRVFKTDYFDEKRTVTMSADQSLDVEITPRAAPADVAGTYGVTFTASASCTTFPAELKTRTYMARIDQNGVLLLTTLSGASFETKRNTFPGRVLGNTVTLNIGTDGFYDYAYYGATLREVLPSGQILGISGTMTAAVTPQSISGPLTGRFTMTLKNGGQVTYCSGNDNRVVFTRQ
jgi:hypothetical protein